MRDGNYETLEDIKELEIIRQERKVRDKTCLKRNMSIV